MASKYKIFIIAGEPSGDLLGAELMKALKATSSKVIQFQGIGGHLMIQEGLTPLFSSDDLAIMGLMESLGKVFSIWKKLKYLEQYLNDNPPDILITIDFPGFNFRLGGALKENRTYPHIHYVAPTVWAIRPERAKKVSQFLDHLLTLFPFEPPYFEKEGLRATFIGHPIAEMALDQGSGEIFKAKYNIDPDSQVLCLLPGSREKEILRHLPVFKETIQGLVNKGLEIHTILPTVPGVYGLVKSGTKDWPTPITIVTDQNEKKDAYSASIMALAASGTVALELAAAHLPMIITYKLSAFSAFMVRRLIKIPYVCMVNILLNKPIVPELLQEKCDSQYLIPTLEKFLNNKSLRDQQIKESYQAIKMLNPQDKVTPNQMAAKVIWDVYSNNKLNSTK